MNWCSISLSSLILSQKTEKFTSALMEAPNGKTYAIDSTLPRDTVKAWAEELEPAK